MNKATKIRQAFRQPSLSHPFLAQYRRCQYHSYEHEKAPSFPPTETSILSAGLALVPELGFTQDALIQGARDAGYREISTNIFPDGVFALVRYHLATQRLALASKHVDQDLGTALQIKELTLKRLHANSPIIHRWQEVPLLVSCRDTQLTFPVGTFTHGCSLAHSGLPARAGPPFRRNPVPSWRLEC